MRRKTDLMREATSTIPRWVRIAYAVMNWMDHWKPLSFNWLYRRYQLLDDACGCIQCQTRRQEGTQGPRKWGRRTQSCPWQSPNGVFFCQLELGHSGNHRDGKVFWDDSSGVKNAQR